MKAGKNKYDLALQLIADIEAFQGQSGVTRARSCCGVAAQKSFWSLMTYKAAQGFEQGLKADHPAITPSMIYAYAALQSGVRLAMGRRTCR